MPRIQPVQPTQANEKSRQLLEGLQRRMGMVPNMAKTFAHSSAALAAFVNFNQALNSALNPALREQISLAVSGLNGCDYCASAHTLMGVNVGIDEEELTSNLAGQSSDDRTQAALTFARTVVERQGRVTDGDLMLIKAAGYTDTEIVEIVTVVALNLFTNYFHHVVDTDIDFPIVETAGITTS